MEPPPLPNAPPPSAPSPAPPPAAYLDGDLDPAGLPAPPAGGGPGGSARDPHAPDAAGRDPDGAEPILCQSKALRLGLVASGLVFVAGALLALPLADAFEGEHLPVLGLLRLGLLVGASLAFAGYALAHPGLVWSGSSLAAGMVYLHARGAWPILPIAALALAAAALWQARQPPRPRPAPRYGNWVPSPHPPQWSNLASGSPALPNPLNDWP